MRVLLLLLLLTPLAFSISDGSSVLWNFHAYIVKILSTVEENTSACTGVIISPSAVLTSSECFKDLDDDKLIDAIVLSPRGNGSISWKRKVYRLKRSADFALLTIRPKKSEELCPHQPAIPRAARLPLSSSPLEPMWAPVQLEGIANQNCRMIGFETVRQEDYIKDNILLHNTINLEEDLGMMTSHVAAGKGACWDDIGVPVECELEIGKWTVVGLLQGITKDLEQDQVSEDDYCTIITGMRFSMFSDSQVGRLITGISSEVFGTFTKCFTVGGDRQNDEKEENKEKEKTEEREEQEELEESVENMEREEPEGKENQEDQKEEENKEREETEEKEEQEAKEEKLEKDEQEENKETDD